jgi:hypothetical protein
MSSQPPYQSYIAAIKTNILNNQLVEEEEQPGWHQNSNNSEGAIGANTRDVHSNQSDVHIKPMKQQPTSLTLLELSEKFMSQDFLPLLFVYALCNLNLTHKRTFSSIQSITFDFTIIHSTKDSLVTASEAAEEMPKR